MATQTVESLIEGGKATAAPPLGPALGPLGVNIGQVIAEINKKTQDFKGMQVPVKIEIDTDTKAFTISVGTPPASALIKQEAKVQKASGKPHEEFVADLKIEQIIKISKMKDDALLSKDNKNMVKEIVGTCRSMGIMVEGKPAKEAMKDIEAGKFDEKIKSGKTELSAAELKTLEEERKHMQEELEKKHAEFEAKAKEILAANEGKEKSVIKAALKEGGIPDDMITKLLPAEAQPGAPPAPGAEKKEEPKKEEKK